MIENTAVGKGADFVQSTSTSTDGSPHLSEEIIRAIHNATVYIEKSIEEGNESSVDRLYHPQYINSNSSREQQVRLCTNMIQDGNHNQTKRCINSVKDFGIFSDIHVVAEALKKVLNKYAALTPLSLYDDLRTMLKKSDTNLLSTDKLQSWHGYEIFIKFFFHLSRLCTNGSRSKRNDQSILAKVFAPVFFPTLEACEQKQLIGYLIQLMDQSQKTVATSDFVSYKSRARHDDTILVDENNTETSRASRFKSAVEISSYKISADPRIVASYKRHFVVMTAAKEQLLAAHSLLQRFDCTDPKLLALKII
jgi:hypothetical protein